MPVHTPLQLESATQVPSITSISHTAGEPSCLQACLLLRRLLRRQLAVGQQGQRDAVRVVQEVLRQHGPCGRVKPSRHPLLACIHTQRTASHTLPHPRGAPFCDRRLPRQHCLPPCLLTEHVLSVSQRRFQVLLQGRRGHAWGPNQSKQSFFFGFFVLFFRQQGRCYKAPASKSRLTAPDGSALPARWRPTAACNALTYARTRLLHAADSRALGRLEPPRAAAHQGAFPLQRLKGRQAVQPEA